MDVFFSLRDGKGFAAVGRDQIELTGGVVFRVGVGIVAALVGGSSCARRGRRSSVPSGDHLGSESWPDCVSWIRVLLSSR